ncbi:hypothetical protein [Algoriphagus taiwanensis]
MKERLRWIGAAAMAWIVIYLSAYRKEDIIWDLISQVSDVIQVFLG